MEEDIAVKDKLGSSNQMASVAELETSEQEISSRSQSPSVAESEPVPVSDPLGIPDAFDICQESARKDDSLEVSSEPDNHHLNAICLSIRVAIIRCFYSSSSCPTTALQMLKEEDNELCVTVNVEDINFFVQKFEKTGCVNGNHMDRTVLESRHAVNPHNIVETVFDNPFENNSEAVYKVNKEIEDFSHTVFLQTGEISEEGCPSKDQVKIKKRAPSIRKIKKEHSQIHSSEIQKPLIKRKYVRKTNFDSPGSSQNKAVKKVKRKKVTRKFPRVGKNECRICKKKCPDRPSFTYHFLSHFNLTFLPKEGPHECPACHKILARRTNLYDHLFHICRFKDYDFSQNQKSSDAPQSLDLAETSNCMQNVDSKLHSHSAHDTSLPANYSFPEFPTEDGRFTNQKSSSLQDQIDQNLGKTNEDIGSSKKSSEKTYKCSRCSVILPDMRSLTYHVADHFDLSHLKGDPPYKCPECDQHFLRRDYLYKHLISSCKKGKGWPETPFNCHLCSRAFQYKIQLDHHILVHSGKAKSKECCFCGKKFNTITGFTYHLVSHHAENKPHQCDQCPRYFKNQKFLEEHKLSHSGTFLYTCEVCGKNYDTSKSFNEHTKRHTEKPRWQCDLCGKYYSGKDFKKNYKQHMRTHTQEIVAVCDLCGKGFTQKGNLRIHYKSCQRQMLSVNQQVY